MRHLQQVYEQYRERGLVVLGFDCQDRREIAQDFLDSCEVTFPSVIDTSRAARDLCFKELQTLSGYSSVPLTYVIGRDGRIAKAWYGNRRREYPKIVKELGLE